MASLRCRPSCLALALAACSGRDTHASPGWIDGPCMGQECYRGAACFDDVCVAVDGSQFDRQITVDDQVDVLFVIDNSGSMGEVQARLVAALPTFVDVIESSPSAFSYRIGVTTTDNGNPWCETSSPEQGALQLASCRAHIDEFASDTIDATFACTDHCALAELATTATATDLGEDEPHPRPWLESFAGVSNLAAIDGATPSLLEALQCALPQGIAGCGYESPLESMFAALRRSDADDDVQRGFMRPGAALAIALVSDEVDCSYADPSIFLPAASGGNPSAFWSDPTAASPTSAVCWRAGVSCSGGPDTYDACMSADKDVDGGAATAGEAVLHPIARYVDRLQQIEEKQQTITPERQLLLTLVTGVPLGYSAGQPIVYADAASSTEQDEFGVGPGCIDPPIAARPPVREREVAERFVVGEQTNLHSICAPDLSPALASFADTIRSQLQPGCMPDCVADLDASTNAVDPACRVEVSLAGGTPVFLPPCDDDDTLPDGVDECWSALTDDEMSQFCAELGWNLELMVRRRPGRPATPRAQLFVSCALSSTKDVDCPGLP